MNLTRKGYSLLMLVAATAFFTGCKGNSGAFIGEAEKIIEFDLSKEVSDIFSIGLLEDPVLLNLASDSVLVGEIDQLIAFKNRIYLLSDNKQGKGSVFIFNDKGNFIRHIQRVGRGPLEYMGLESMFVDHEKERLGIYTRTFEKIIYFDLDGNVLTEMQMPKPFNRIWKTGFGYAVDMGNYGQDMNHRDNLWLMDYDFTLLRSFFDIPVSWESNGIGNVQNFSDYKNKTYYTRPLDHNVYIIEENGLAIPYGFDFGKANWPDPKAGFEQYKQIIQDFPGRYVYRFDRFQETDRHIIVQFLHEGQNRLGVYDKESGKSTVCSMGTYIGKYFIPFGRITAIDSEAIYAIVEAYSMKRIWDGKDQYNDFESEYPEQIRRLREEFPIIEENGNPFLVIYRFK